MGKTFNINIENLIENLHISCKPEDSQKVRSMVKEALLNALKDTLDSKESWCFREKLGYTKDDMIEFATHMMDSIADIPKAHEASKNDLKKWDKKKK